MKSRFKAIVSLFFAILLFSSLPVLGQDSCPDETATNSSIPDSAEVHFDVSDSVTADNDDSTPPRNPSIDRTGGTTYEPGDFGGGSRNESP